jgi:hypothetical protein
MSRTRERPNFGVACLRGTSTYRTRYEPTFDVAYSREANLQPRLPERDRPSMSRIRVVITFESGQS